MFSALMVCAFALSPRFDAEGVPLPADALARVGTAKWRHHHSLGPPLAAADGRHVYTPTDKPDVLAWDAATGLVTRSFAVPFLGEPEVVKRLGGQYLLDRTARVSGYVQRRVEWSAGGRLRVIDGASGFATVRTVDPHSGRVLGTTSVPGPSCLRVELTPDGRWLAAHVVDVRDTPLEKSERHLLKVYAATTMTPAYDVAVDGRVHAFAFSPDDRLLAVADSSSFRFLDAATGTPVRTVTYPQDRYVEQFRFRPDSAAVAVVMKVDRADEDRLEVWPTAAGGAVVGTRLVGHRRLPWAKPCLLFRPDGGQVATGEYGQPWQFFDPATGRVTASATSASNAGHRGAAYSPDGRRFYAIGIASCYDLVAWDPSADPPVIPPGLTDWQHGATFTRGGDLRGVVGRIVVHWSAATGRTTRTTLDVPEPENCWSHLSPDGERVAVFSGNWTALPAKSFITVVHFATGRTTKLTRENLGYVTHVEFSPDGETLTVFIDSNLEETWRLATREHSTRPLPRPLVDNADRRLSLAGAGLLSWAVRRNLSDENNRRAPLPVQFFDREDYQKPRWAFTPWMADYEPRIAMPDNRRVVLKVMEPGRHAIELWDGPTARRLWRQPLATINDQVSTLSPDGRSFVGTSGHQLALFETASGQIRHAFVGHRSHVWGLSFSPDGRLLAAHSVEAPVYLWDVRGDLQKPATPESTAAWDDLASSDATVAFRAVRRLAWFPEFSLPLLRAKLPPAGESVKYAEWIAALDAPAFADREAATKRLRAAGERAVLQLEAAGKATASAEGRARIERLLHAIAGDSPTGDALREVRAVETVEWIGTPEAKALLKTWAAGAAGARLTREAKEALHRARP